MTRKLKAAAHGVALLLALGACARHEAEARKTPEAAARAVRTADVERGGPGEASVPASVRARQRAALAARLSAAVVELPHREGDAVAKGAVLVRLDDQALRSALAAAEAGAVAAEADLARAEALLGRKAATPREAEDARARAASARSAVQAAQDAHSYAVLRAPFAGVVASRSVDVGDIVSPGAPLLEIEGEGGLELVATLDASETTRVRIGQTLMANMDGQAAPVAATVRSLSPAGDPTTHRFEMRADLKPTPGLRSGLFARLSLPPAAGETRLLVPQAAVFQRGGLTGVFVVAQGRARLRWIAVGEVRRGAAEVRAGVSEGEKVVLDPAGLADGDAVTEPR